MLDRFERAMERIIEGSVAGLFRLRVQPAEIGRRLERAMLDGRVASVGMTLAPNAYEVRLHPDDAAFFADWDEALSREMETWLAEVAYARGLTTVGPLQVLMVADGRVRRRSVRVTANFSGRASGPTAKATRPWQVQLKPIDGGFSSLTLSGSAPKTVGRDQDNDLVLPHPEISRRHARFERAGEGWRVVDLDSTNGTWVNGERIGAESVSVGDHVAFGGIQYVVGPG